MISTDMQILMLLLGIDCPDYKNYFFTSKGDLWEQNCSVVRKTKVFRDLWEFLDHYGVEYNQRGPNLTPKP
jgi:hypothetical protein